jgi:homoserine kinase type II
MAVYTTLSRAEAQEFLADYDLGPLRSLDGIKAGVENTNYRLGAGQDDYILTLYEKRTKSEDLPFFLGLMEYLAAKGILCPRPVKRRDGQTVGQAKGRAAALFTLLPGQTRARVVPSDCAELGAMLAQVHLAGLDFPMQRPNAMGLATWQSMVAACADRMDEVQPGLKALTHDELGQLQAGWPRDLPQGIIHADLFPDNTLFTGDRMTGVIDFYFACNDVLAYDLAICLNAWCFEGNVAFNITKARAMLHAYAKIRPLTDTEKAALPLLARGAALRFLLSRLHDWLNRPADALVKAKDPLAYHAQIKFLNGIRDLQQLGYDG